jgi:SAM-dependent methyltransferase
VRRVEHGREILDGPTPAPDRAASLADIERLNAWFGGHALTVRHVARALRSVPPARPVRILDVGAGAGHLAVRLVRWARAAGRPIRVIALDRDIGPARAATRRYPEIAVVSGDAAALPVRPGAVDLVVSSLVLHHLSREAAVAALREMARAGRLGFVVNDLWRARLGVALVWLATRLVARHPISRHDGPLSVRRSYSPDEIRRLAAEARVPRLAIHRYPWLVRILILGGGLRPPSEPPPRDFLGGGRRPPSGPPPGMAPAKPALEQSIPVREGG